MELLTNSRLKSFRACQRMHRYQYVDCVRPVVDSSAQRFGTAVHKALEIYWLGRMGIEVVGGFDPFAGLEPFDRARAEAMLAGYISLWDEVSEVEVLAVEREFQLPLVNPATAAKSRTYLLGGKLDLVLRIAGRVAVVEHKTSGEDVSPGSSYQQRLVMDSQVSAYWEGSEAAGFAPDELLYDVLAKPAIRPFKATPIESRKYVAKTGALYANQHAEDETPDAYRDRCIATIAAAPHDYYAQIQVPRLETERDSHRHDVWNLARQVRDAELYGNDVRNPDACHRYGSACAFFPVCSGTASLDDPSLYRRAERQHEELAATAAA